MSRDDEELADTVLRAAEDAFARVMSGVEEQVDRMPPDLEPADALRWAGDRVTELLAGFAELPLERMLGFGDPTIATDVPGDDHDHDRDTAGTAPQGEPIVVHAARGSLAEARVWVHPIGPVPPSTLEFALGGLTDPDGASWTSPDVIFTPAELTLPVDVPAAATSTVLQLRIPDDALPGDHHGLIIGRGGPGAVLPITLVVS